MSLTRCLKVVGAILAVASTAALAKDPDCTRQDGWPASMAHSFLRDEGIIGIGADVKWNETRVERIASEKIGRDMYRQVHKIQFTKATGEKVTVLTVNNASHTECSESDPDVYVVSRQLGSAREAQTPASAPTKK